MTISNHEKVKFRKREKGQAQILVFVIGISLALAIYYLANRVLINSSQISKNKNDTYSSMILNSVLDYSIFVMKQRWCLQDNMLQDTNCLWINEKNLERLILTEEQINFLKDLRSKDVLKEELPNPLSLDEVEIKVSIGELSADHPLSFMISKNKLPDFKYFKVKFYKDVNLDAPLVGQGLFLFVEVSLLDKNEKVMYAGSNKLAAKSYISLHPRELYNFALVVLKDLRLDGGVGLPSHSKDAVFPVIDLTNQSQGQASVRDFLFESPVFVERDIYLLKPSDQGSGKIAPVVFSDRVIQGSGTVKTNQGSPYTPPQDETFWSQSKVFGGFLKGLDTDGAVDLGASHFLSPGTSSLNPDFSLCRDLASKRNSVDAMLDSKLIVEHLNSSASMVTQYRLGLSDYNELSKQTIGASGVINVKNVSSNLPFDTKYIKEIKDIEIVNPKVNEDAHGSIMKVNTLIGKKEVEFYLPFKGSVEFEIKNNIPDKKNAKIIFSANPVIVNQNEQPHLVDLKVEVLNPEMLKFTYLDTTVTPPKYVYGEDIQISSKVLLYDKLFKGGQPIAQASEDPSWFNRPPPTSINDKWDRHVTLQTRNFGLGKGSGSQLEWSEGMLKPTDLDEFFSGGSPFLYNEKAPSNDLASSIEQCSNSGSGGAFGANWGVSFADQTRWAWNIVSADGAGVDPNKDPLTGTLVFNQSNSLKHTTEFRIVSIVGNCIIEDSAQVITGFFVCDNLEIRPRSSPLRIIGTFIVGQLKVDKTVYKNGVRWSNIYHPQAVIDLKAMNILKPRTDGITCSDVEEKLPLWHPKPALNDHQDRFLCSPASLSSESSVFQYTTIDPDCGLIPGSLQPVCKRKYNRFILKEHSREMGI